MSTTTDWIIAFSSVAAAAATSGSLYATVTLLRRQDDERRRSQAARVIVVRREGSWPPVLDVHNDSDQAIYNVTSYAEGGSTRLIDSDDEIAVVRPGQRATLTMVRAFAGTPRDAIVPPLAVLFLDEIGRVWMRWEHGRLEEVGPIFLEDWPLRTRIKRRVRRLIPKRWRTDDELVLVRTPGRFR